MCLKLTKDSARLRKNFRRRKKLIPVWKLLCFSNKIGSVAQNYKWKYGWNLSSRGDKAKISELERNIGSVQEGFHFFLSEKDTYKWAVCLQDGKVVVKMCVKPQDIVAVGNDSDQCLTSLVATRAYLPKPGEEEPK